MQARVLEVVAGLEEHPPALPEEEIRQGVELLRWLADDHFAFLGYREYRLEQEDSELALTAIPGTGLGILRGDPQKSMAFDKLPPPVRERAREPKLLVLAKANSKSTVHRTAYLDYVGVKTFDESGTVIGERRFLGLFSAATYTESVMRIPVLRDKVNGVLETLALNDHSHAGKSLVNVLENYPRDELFHTPLEELVPIVEAVILTRERRQLRLFTRRDTYGRYLSCLVYLPRDRYNTAVRERLAGILKDALHGETVEFTVRVNESYLAQVHFVVRPPRGQLIAEVDTAELEAKLGEAARSWRDDLAAAIMTDFGEERGASLARRYADAFPEAYKEDFPPRTGSVDVARIEAIEGDLGIDLALSEPVDAPPGEGRLKVYRVGKPLSLSEVLPMISSLGVEVVDERPYELENLPRQTYIYDFGLRAPRDLPDRARGDFQDALRAVWDGFNEIDGFNALVLQAGLDWRQATVLRAYAKYMKQGSSPFAVDYIEEALRSNPEITRLLVELFEARFDPGPDGEDLDPDSPERQQRMTELRDSIEAALDDVASLDQDRILRSYLTHILATLRTNFYQRPDRVSVRSYMSFKLEPSAIPDLPRRAPSSRSSSIRPGSKASTFGSARWPEAGCAGLIDETTSAPRSSVWSRPRWSRTR